METRSERSLSCLRPTAAMRRRMYMSTGSSDARPVRVAGSAVQSQYRSSGEGGYVPTRAGLGA
eukprot:2635981-Rhodomonas_salina.1